MLTATDGGGRARDGKGARRAGGGGMRRKSGPVYQALAYRCKLHPTYISQLERGVKSPTVRVLMLISGAIGIRASEILREAEDL